MEVICTDEKFLKYWFNNFYKLFTFNINKIKYIYLHFFLCAILQV